MYPRHHHKDRSYHRAPLLALACLGAAMLTGCGVPESRTAGGIVASDDPRIWVVRETHTKDQVIAEVFRCADGAAATEPPKPVCVKAPMGDGQ